MSVNKTIPDGLDEPTREIDVATALPSRLIPGPNGLLVMPSRDGGKEITQEMVNAARDDGYFG